MRELERVAEIRLTGEFDVELSIRQTGLQSLRVTEGRSEAKTLSMTEIALA